ncbi:MAG: hypothetical protein ABI411_10380 [Tahibacter sp.]
MSNHQEARLLVHLLREGRDYYTFARDEVHDAEISRLFARAEMARRGLLDALVNSRLLYQASATLPVEALGTNTGYAHLQAQFDPYHSELQAPALLDREQRVLALIRHVFEVDDCEQLRTVLKAHYSSFAACAASLHVLAQRQLAAA